MTRPTYIGGLVVDTDSQFIAAHVATKAHTPYGARGVVAVGGQLVRWATVHEFNKQGGFTPPSISPEKRSSTHV